MKLNLVESSEIMVSIIVGIIERFPLFFPNAEYKQPAKLRNINGKDCEK